MADSSKLLNAKPHATLAVLSSGQSLNMVGMVISGRAAKACDVCGKERARWYCAADSAYLCERCDRSVHSANAVAGRHERARLGPNGTPVKIASVIVKQDAALPPEPSTDVQLNPRKRPRSIRRHKPRSFHASKCGMSSRMHASNPSYGSSQYASNFCSETGSILASTHGVMINNPRNNPDFIANINSYEPFNKAIVVKSEPYSPVDVGDQVKVPDHVDDDHLLECLFGFRDLEDDDLFLHEVPIYNPLQSQADLSQPPQREQCAEEEEAEETKPIINQLVPPTAISSVDTHSANAQYSPELSQAEDSKLGLPRLLSAQDVESPSSFAECNEADPSSGSDICDLDQLDFECVLQGDGEDGEGHASMDVDIKLDVYVSHETTEANACGDAPYDHHGNDSTMADDAAAGHCDGDHHPNYVADFDFDSTGSESPCTWLCKVKVESPPELGMVQDQHMSTELYDDALLREKLICKTLSAESQHTFKLGLKLNVEDVLSTWSDKGSFWMDGLGPSQVGNCLDFLGGCFVPDVSGPLGTEGPEGQLVPVLNHNSMRSDGGAREASVLRYREKRRTRLFSKKIRYEVRKLNAEKRPRMKGRFVKRIAT